MAHKRKDTYVESPEWWRHLRPLNKQRVAKRERQAAKKRIRKEVQQQPEEQPVK